MLPFDLPNWNEGMQATATFGRKEDAQQPENKPSNQLAIHRPDPLQVTELENQLTDRDPVYWLNKAAIHEASHQQDAAEKVLMEALQHDVQPVTSIAKALHELHKKREALDSQGNSNKNAKDVPLVLSAYLNVSNHATTSLSPHHPRASITPSRIGLSGQAVRIPSELAKTPGSARNPEATAPPATKFNGILKKLEFSTLKTHTDSSGVVQFAVPPTTLVTTTTTSISAADTATNATMTTTKRLHFEGRDTPLLQSNANTTLSKQYATTMTPSFPPAITTTGGGGRRVTFGADTISPNTKRNIPRRRTSAAMSHTGGFGGGMHTPPPTINEDGDASGGSVNSRNAGATPFDRRLSSLFAKYGGDVGGDDDVNDDDTDDYEEEEEDNDDFTFTLAAPSPPAHQHMSVAETIRALLGHKIIGAGGGEGNAVAASTTAADPRVVSMLSNLLRRSLEDIQASKIEEETSVPRPDMSGIISPSSGTFRVVPPNVAATAIPPPCSSPLPSPMGIRGTPGRVIADSARCQEEEEEEEEGVASAVMEASPSSLSGDDDVDNDDNNNNDDSLSDRSSFTPMSFDGVARSRTGVPLTTPGTVTVFRGSGGGPAISHDSLPVDLSRSFDTPGSNDDSVSPGFAFDVIQQAPDVLVDASPTALPSQQTNTDPITTTTNPNYHHNEEEKEEEEEIHPFDDQNDLPIADASSSFAFPSVSSAIARSATSPLPCMARPSSTSTSRIRSLHQATIASGNNGRGGNSTPPSSSSPLPSVFFGKAQRIPSLSPEQSVTKEVRGMMKNLALDTERKSNGGDGGKSSQKSTDSNTRNMSPMQGPVDLSAVRRSPRIASMPGSTKRGGGGLVPTPTSTTSKTPRQRTTTNATTTTPSSTMKTPASTPTTMRGTGGGSIKKGNGKIHQQQPGSGHSSGGSSGKISPSDSSLKLSPTEQNIRDSLRRSSRLNRKTLESPN